MAKLTVVDGPDRGAEFPLSDEAGATLTIGRDPRNAVALNDGSVSRDHFKIEFTPKGFRLVDLGSKNRTFLNGKPVLESALRAGDLIGAGDSELRFETEREAEEEGAGGSTILKELSATGGIAVGEFLKRASAAQQPRPEGAREESPREERFQKAFAAVRQLLDISHAIARARDPDELFRELLAILVPALESSSGAVLTNNGRRWVVRATLGSQDAAAAAGASPPVSLSIVRKAATEGKALISAATSRDERFLAKESVIQSGIVSAIAAPVFSPVPAQASEGARGEVVAVLYADRRGQGDGPFGEDELGLLLAAAEQAAPVMARREEEVRLREENKTLLRTIADARRMVGRSQAMDAVLEFVRRAAPAPQTVLIRGETGTGKEMVASAIHFQGMRQGKPFVAINCAAIPETLIESELFGHERGAFTGAASRRRGRFELAHTGTVFLDEIGELPLACQTKLLRLLEERKFERLGGAESVEVDVRIIAATNRDLARAIAQGQFREDLFYRLNVLGVTLPPLRDRKEDIPLFAEHFLQAAGGGRRTFTPQALERLASYAWPGNIRELRNVVERAVVLTDAPAIDTGDLNLTSGAGPAREGDLTSPLQTAGGGAGWEPVSLDDLQQRHIQRVLEHTQGNKKRAADILGIERCTLYAKLRAMGVLKTTPKGPALQKETTMPQSQARRRLAAPTKGLPATSASPEEKKP